MSEDIYVKQRQQIIENLDVLIENKGWEESLALKVIQGRIVAYRDSLQDEIVEYQESHQDICTATQEKKEKMAEDDVAVYVCLYRSFGDNIPKWEQTLAILTGNVLGRPVYRSEEEADKFISDKVNREPEAYIEVWIKKNMILELPPQRKMSDKFGSELLSLKQGAVSPDKIKYFTSGVGGKYRYVKGKLLPLT